MKKIILSILVLGAIAAAVFFASKSEPVAAETAPASPAVKAAVEAPKLASPVTTPLPVSPPGAETHQVAPATTRLAQAPKPKTEQPATPSPRAELATMIPELVRLIEAQDYETLMQDFMPPDELDAMLADLGQPGQPMTLVDLANRMRQDPGMAQKMATASQFLGYLQTQTPTFDETGEMASYPMPMVINGKSSVDFVKEAGNWYVKDGRQFFR